jgi:ABC-type uncharacterized transport system permease subunit
MKIYAIGALFTLFCLASESNRNKLAAQIHGDVNRDKQSMSVDLVLGTLMWPMTLLVLLNIL